MTFDAAMILTRSVSSPTAFEDEECRAYFDTLMSLDPGSLIVEIGLEYGRSTSIALQVARYRDLRYCGCDIDVRHEWIAMASPLLSPDRGFVNCSSTDLLTASIAAILIDGDHSYEGVLADCDWFLPNVTDYAMFHDYRRESLPDVTRAIDDYMIGRESEWHHVGVYGTLGIWRRV